MSDLIERLQACYEDPMWADHSEVPKALLRSAAAEIKRLQAEIAKWERLRDRATLHTNLVRGFPAALSRESLLHLAGADQLLDALAEADRLIDHCDEPTEWRERWAHLFKREPHTQQGEAHD